MSSYTVTGIKDFVGRNGHGFNAFLHRDGHKVAFVTEHANGGAVSFDWLAKTHEERTLEAETLDAHCAAQPPVNLSDDPERPQLFPMDADLFVTQLVEAEERRRAMKSTLKRLLTKRVIFELDGQLRMTGVLAAITPAHIDAVAKRHPKAPILNAMPFDEALALYMDRAA